MAAARHREIAEKLRREILGGKWLSPGNSFPSERVLAKRFGVSRPTITLALQELRGKGLILRQHGKGTFLTKTACKLGRAIGLVVPGISYGEVYPVICREVSRLAQKDGLTLLFGDVSSSDPKVRARRAIELATRFADEGVSGVIFQPIELVDDSDRVNRQFLSVFEKAGVPVVLMDNDIVPSPERSSYDVVSINSFEAGRRVAQHLRDSGARSVHFLMNPNWGHCLENRLLGVKSVFGGAVRVVDIDPKDLGAVRKFVRMRPRPEAAICRNDDFAVHLVVALRKLGVGVPGDLLVTGFNDLAYATLLDPPLTTIHVPCEAIAQTAYATLMMRLADPSLPPRECYLPAPLVVRGSTSRSMRRAPR